MIWGLHSGVYSKLILCLQHQHPTYGQRLVQNEASNVEFHLVLPHGRQESRHVGHHRLLLWVHLLVS